MKLLNKIIFWLYASLLFLVPLVLWPYTSEVFEFNKIVLVYLLTIPIISVWIGKMIIERKFIYRRTLLEMPILIFIASQAISTLLSIDVYTSLFGYYSRFNGGFLSVLAYSLLYFGFVSNIDKSGAMKLLKVFAVSAMLVSFYGILEHFGIDKDIWVQDVQSRVFSTLGQPNWLAAFLAAFIPVFWALMLDGGKKDLRFFVFLSLNIIFFWTLIFTKSRSGFLGAVVAGILFWSYEFLHTKENFRNRFSVFLVSVLPLFLICLISGTQWTPSISGLINRQVAPAGKEAVGAALETGGTESGTIRKIVWEGAFNIFKSYPVFGTGVETFAYSYYQFRPQSHNLTSEWDFIYNKAHNEFLNYAATTGVVGVGAYIVLIVFSVLTILKTPGLKSLKIGIAAGFLSLSVSNFFGFSVVPTQLQFFLLPAFAVSLGLNKNSENSEFEPAVTQKVFLFLTLIIALVLIGRVINYWQADILFSRARAFNSTTRPDLAIKTLQEAIKLTPDQPIYTGELATSYSTIAMAYDQAGEATTAAEFVKLAALATEKSVKMSPANINLRRQMFGVYVRLSTINEDFLTHARDSLIETLKLAPTDAKLHYNLGVAQANLGQFDEAAQTLKKTVELKSNYIDARIELAAVLAHLKRKDEARQELNYVLTNLDPKNSTAIQALANLN